MLLFAMMTECHKGIVLSGILIVYFRCNSMVLISHLRLQPCWGTWIPDLVPRPRLLEICIKNEGHIKNGLALLALCLYVMLGMGANGGLILDLGGKASSLYKWWCFV